MEIPFWGPYGQTFYTAKIQHPALGASFLRQNSFPSSPNNYKKVRLKSLQISKRFENQVCVEQLTVDFSQLNVTVTDPSGVRFSVTGNVLKIGKPRSPWGKYFDSVLTVLVFDAVLAHFLKFIFDRQRTCLQSPLLRKLLVKSARIYLGR